MGRRSTVREIQCQRAAPLPSPFLPSPPLPATHLLEGRIKLPPQPLNVLKRLVHGGVLLQLHSQRHRLLRRGWRGARDAAHHGALLLAPEPL